MYGFLFIFSLTSEVPLKGPQFNSVNIAHILYSDYFSSLRDVGVWGGIGNEESAKLKSIYSAFSANFYVFELLSNYFTKSV